MLNGKGDTTIVGKMTLCVICSEHSDVSRNTESQHSHAAGSASTTRSSDAGTRSKDQTGTKSKKRKKRKDFIKINMEVVSKLLCIVDLFFFVKLATINFS